MSEVKFKVIVMDVYGWGVKERTAAKAVRLDRARSICARNARRGVRKFGGRTEIQNWGHRGGIFPMQYRAARIEVA